MGLTNFFAYMAGGAGLFALWYGCCLRSSRRRAAMIIRWLQSALAGEGQVAGICWKAPSCFFLPLKLVSTTFKKPRIRVELAPKELPLRWLLGRLKKHQDTLTFEADLNVAPDFFLHLHNSQMFARTNKKVDIDPDRWDFAQSTPFVLTSRKDWQKEVMQVFTSLLSRRDRHFLNITFNESSPHFSATVPLDAISPYSQPQRIFETLREVAGAPQAKIH